MIFGEPWQAFVLMTFCGCPVQVTLLVDRNGAVRMARVEVGYRHRLDPGDVIDALTAV